MHIAQVSPLIESVPPALYGGTERIVSYLTEELVAAGHDVTLFATADSRTSARLMPFAPRALRIQKSDPIPYLLVMLHEIRRAAAAFDVIHFHMDPLQFPLFSGLEDRCVTTLHGRLDLPDLPVIYHAFPQMPLVSISDAQRRPLAFARWVRTVAHGLPPDLLPFDGQGGGHLAFLGRVSPEKRLDRAIRIAVAAGMPLVIGAKVDRVDEAYFEREIRPLLGHPLITFLGEVAEAAKARLLGSALALLFPIDWPEPFGLVMIEAMACGTPVIAWRAGSVPEVVDPGITGFIVEGEEEAVAAIGAAARLDRRQVRATFERRFSSRRMAEDYVEVYEDVTRSRTPTPARAA
jgi:glycosyltransferase involved in cell wall biosynthesis